MVSLLSVVLMAEWSTITRPVYEKQVFMVILLTGIAMLCSFGLLTVIIGVVVERTTEAMNGVRQHHLELQRSVQMEQAKVLAEIMFDLDADGDNRICRAEMELGANHEQLQLLLDSIELPTCFTFGELFDM